MYITDIELNDQVDIFEGISLTETTHFVLYRVPTHLENLEFGLKKIMEFKKKGLFMEKSWKFVSVIHIFFQYQNKFCRINLLFVTCVSFLA